MLSEIKKLVAQEEYDRALSLLRPFCASDSAAEEISKIAKIISSIPNHVFIANGYLLKKIAIFSGYTCNMISDQLVYELFSRGILPQIWMSEYGLVEQLLLAPDPGLNSFQPDLIYLCVGAEHLALTDESDPVKISKHWLDSILIGHENYKCDFVMNTFEEPVNRVFGHYEAKYMSSPTNLIRRINFDLADSSPGYLHFFDVNFLSSFWGKQTWRDEGLFDVTKIPVASDAIFYYGKQLASLCSALFGRSKKCIVLDLDNTIWGGVIGDLGPFEIKIGSDSGEGESFLRFQKYLKELKNRGIILAVCSKNDELIAQEPFLRNPNMILKLSDISFFCANWNPKSDNIRIISNELQISFDSMVLIDDNPAERELVRNEIPNLSTIEMPADPSCFTRALSVCGFFESIAITEEDRSRTMQYKENRERTQTLAKMSDDSLDNFLADLHMRAIIRPFDGPNMPRIVQLINKTNQFNLTTRRITRSEADFFQSSISHATWYVKLTDKFGDNGLISVAVGEILNDLICIDLWVMSCRVLKRKVEIALLAEIVKYAKSLNISYLVGKYLPSEKNGIVSNFYADQGFTLMDSEGELAKSWSLDLGDELKVDRILSQVLPIEIIITNAD